MGNMCCRREVFAPNAADTDPSRFGHHHQTQHQLGAEHHPQKPHQPQQRPVMSSAYHPAGDDCAINELLEGRMDLDVLMPDGRQVRLTVERRTPMMDLLVQAASATKISPGSHVIQVFGDGDKSNGTLPYKPSTPIGTLDTNTIYVVPKKEAIDLQSRRNGKTAYRPFEPTFRVQVHLPRNQLTVLRVSPRVKIAELKVMVCKEKGLDTSRYQLVRPSGTTQPLSGDMTLSEYGSTEITLLSNSSIESNICNSTSHIMPYPKRTEEQKRKTGILRLLAEDANHKNANLNSTHQIDGNQRKAKAKPEDSNVHQHRFKPKKRRPAPPPPPPVLPEAPSHSRQSSSDSSGYHEATSSFLHEEHSGEEKASSDSSGVSSLDAKGPSIQQPTTPPIPNSKKKKAPAPPPPPPKKKKEIQKGTVVLKNQPSKEDVSTQKDPVIYKDVILHKEPEIQVCNTVIESDSISKTNFTENDLTVEKNCTENNSILQNDSIVLTNQIVQTILTTETNEVAKSSPVLDDIILTNHSSLEKNTPLYESMVVLNNDLNLKDCVTKQDTLYKNDQNPSKDSVILQDQMILVDPVLKQDAKLEENVGLQILENEGNKFQLQVPMATEDMPVQKVPTELNEEKIRKCEKVVEVKQKTAAPSSLVLDTHRCSSLEKKVEKNKLSSKSEAVSTRVALVALNARIEQDVTQQEIASSIQAAFHSLDCSPQQPSLLAIKQRNSENLVTNSFQYSNGSSESCEIQPRLKTPVTLNSKSCSKVVKESLSETSTRFSAFEKEALLIDEEPPTRPVSATPISTTNLKRSSSLLNFAEATVPRNAPCKNTKRVRHLQRSLSDLSAEDKEDFETEQDRLQQEYIKLQRQFIIWQQQLMNNHAMLREECLVPQYARTLRQSHSLPEGEDYSDETTPSVPLVSRSLSYEPTKERCSTLPRSTINIPSLEFGTLQINNGTTTLRSSKTKSYFKPPQVRVSTKSRQRIPPEIKKEGDVDITDDTKMLTTILPSFESLKLITENSEEDVHLNVSRLKDTIPSTKPSPLIFQGRKVPQVHLSSTFPKLNSRLNNADRIVDRDLKCVNGDTGQSKLLVDSSKITEPSSNVQLPPPPPPMPVGGVTKVRVKENCTKAPGQRNGVGRKEFTPSVDPRDQLMQEIRKFGGRTALRKISLAS